MLCFVSEQLADHLYRTEESG